jgi:hypothetical protein
LSLPK